MSFEEELDQAQRQVREIKAHELRRRGWSYGCENPASLWLWSKTIDGITYALSPDVALEFAQEAGWRERMRRHG